MKDKIMRLMNHGVGLIVNDNCLLSINNSLKERKKVGGGGGERFGISHGSSLFLGPKRRTS